MSGGAFNYFYLKDGGEILQNLNDLEELEAYCRAQDLHDEADEIYQYLLFCKTISRRLNVYSQRMSNLLKAVEWECSGDWNKGHIEQAYEELLKDKSEAKDG